MFFLTQLLELNKMPIIGCLPFRRYYINVLLFLTLHFQIILYRGLCVFVNTSSSDLDSALLFLRHCD